MLPRVRSLLLGLAVAVLFLLPLLPEILGTRRLVFRDAHMTHWPWRRVATEALASGHVPFVSESASGGEPLLANPDAVLLYPTLLFETFLPAACAFNLHYLLHVLWAFFGARALARRLGLPDGSAFVSGIAFAFSGIMLSYASAFMNSGAAAAWLPWCAAAILDLVRAADSRETLRACAATGFAFGLQLLAGEPVLSLLTILFAAFLGSNEILIARQGRLASAKRFVAGGAGAGILAAALASPLLFPLAAVLPLTYRGQHLYSARAFGASPFAPWRTIEWLFPRFGGDPGALAAGAHWQYRLHEGDLIYIWCVTFGVVPLLVIVLAALRGDFWSRHTAWLAGGAFIFLLFAFGSSLPLYRLLFSLGFLRRLRYPIKFYLLTTLCVALLAGFAVEALKQRRAGRRESAVLLGVVALYAAAFAIAREGGPLDRSVEPLLKGLAAAPSALLPAIRASFRGDAIFGLVGVVALGLTLFFPRPVSGRGHLLGFVTLFLSLPWGLPLFVWAKEKDLASPPALLAKMKGPGRLYISPSLPEFSVLASGTAHPQLLPRVSKLARVQIEELIPATGAPFGVRYLFDEDPDGSYGYYNRLASEALSASTPVERGRLLRLYGARWVLAQERESYPLLRPVTGLIVAGRRLVLLELTDPLSELRWAGREFRRTSLSGALELARSESFRPETDIVLPGRSNRNGGSEAAPGRISGVEIEPDQAKARIVASAAGHLVFSRTYFSTWKAKLDGKEVPVLVANARDLAIAVPPGQHEAEFDYNQRPFVRGVAIQAGAFLILLAALFRFRKRS